jgi:hypothetical protein
MRRDAEGMRDAMRKTENEVGGKEAETRLGGCIAGAINLLLMWTSKPPCYGSRRWKVRQ